MVSLLSPLSLAAVRSALEIPPPGCRQGWLRAAVRLPGSPTALDGVQTPGAREPGRAGCWGRGSAGRESRPQGRQQCQGSVDLAEGQWGRAGAG